jgi:myo-inositol 2-dehydrogenase/D-chiro-inositol 1-dehydrogenase
MIRFALFGAGKIGRMHAANLAGHKKAELCWVYDINQARGDEVAATFGARSCNSTEEPLSDPEVNAVLIATSTDTHASLIVESAKAGKAVFCEKPIDISLEKVNRCSDQIKNFDVPIQIGFNRRFDPSHRKVAQAVQNGEIGTLEHVLITSRDPEPPPKEYYLVAGGMLRDMTIHDFDLARFVLNEEVKKVTALTATLFDPVAREIGEIDSAMILMQTESGKLCHINNSRHASYGYDQRLEAHGSKGMIRSENHEQTTVERFNEQGSSWRDPLPFFFIERYRQAFLDQLDAFIEALESNKPTQVNFEDGRKALILANAAYESIESRTTVEVKYN